MPLNPTFKLYDMAVDPYEMRDIAAGNPDIVAKMKKDYVAWFRDVGGTRGYAPPRIHIGTPHENPVILTRQDWRGPRAAWRPDALGHWEVRVARAGNYEITLRFDAEKAPRKAHFKLGGAEVGQDVKAGQEKCVFNPVHLAKGDGRLEAWLAARDKKTVGVSYVDVKQVN